jgi:DNA-binding beta-propeller fold protein YncE
LTDLAIRPDGRFVYVLDSTTGDLTIVDTAGGRVMGRLPLGQTVSYQSAGGPLMGWSNGPSGSRRLTIRPTGGPRPLLLFPESNLLGVRTPNALAFVDMYTNSEVPALRLPGHPNAAAISPDGRRLYVLSTGRVSYLDARTGRFLAALTEFEDPSQIVFAGPQPSGCAAQ